MSTRLDQELLKRKMVLTRSQARMLIKQGDVSVNDKIVMKPGALVQENAEIQITADQLYVSRGAYKLKKAIEEFQLNFSNKVVADCGASTGGFTEVLLENHAKKIYALDVGTDQLHPKIRASEKVVDLSGVNLKDEYRLAEKVDACVADLSFISLKLVFATMDSFLKGNGFMILLIKPQFEAGRERIGKNGLVDEKYHEEIKDVLRDFFIANDYKILGECVSPIQGKKGNIEYLIYLSKDQTRNEA